MKKVVVISAVALALAALGTPANGVLAPPVQVALQNGLGAAGIPNQGLDPAVSFAAAQIEYATCAKLLNYQDSPAPGGWTLVPDAATALPTVSPDGLTYTFSVRGGLGFSPPSTEQVTADSFRVAIERAVKLNDFPLLDDVQGVAAFVSGAATSISGIRVAGSQLSIALTHPDGALPAKLTMPFFCAVPVGTPTSVQTAPIPSAGPYYIDPASLTSDTSGNLTGLALKRNPSYGGSRPAVLPEIDFQLNGNQAAAIAGAQANPPSVDYATNIAPPTRASLATSFGLGSAADLAGHQQYFTAPAGTHFIALNTTRPGLNDARVRRAINFALDRNALSAITATAPTDQLVSPATPGFADASVYPFAGDLATAQSLMAQAGYGPTNRLALTLYVNRGQATRAALAPEVQSELANAYIDVTINDTLKLGQLLQFVNANPSGYDMFMIGWIQDFADGGDVLLPLLDGRELAKTSNANFSRFDDPFYNAQFAADEQLQPGPGRDATWVNLDVDIGANAAPTAPFALFENADFFSARVGCQVEHPVYGIDLTRLCERFAVAAGGTVSSGTPSAAAPVQAAVTTPVAGSIAVSPGPTGSDVSGYALLGQELSIEAPAATAASPLSIAFDVDASALAAAGATAGTLIVLHNGTPVPDCVATDGSASPDPCVASRTTDASSNARIVVLTSHASTWSFGVVDTTPPALTDASLGANPIVVGGTTTLAVAAASDSVLAELYVDVDLGAGNNTLLGGALGSFRSAPFGGGLAAGVHAVGMRVRDAAHNWSAARTAYLVVADGGSGSVAGHGSFVPAGPSSDAGDVLPGADGVAFARFHVRAGKDAAGQPTGEVELELGGFGLHMQSVSIKDVLAAGDWLRVSGSARVAGRPGLWSFTLDARDGTPDRVVVQLWAPGASTASLPTYKASGDVVAGNVASTRG